MPTYVYEVLDKKGKPTGETFEVVQPMKDDALTQQPQTGKPCTDIQKRMSVLCFNTDLTFKATMSTVISKQMSKCFNIGNIIDSDNFKMKIFRIFKPGT